MPAAPRTVDETVEIFMANLTTPHWDALLDLLADDAVMEFPYAPAERPSRLNGKQEIVPYFAALKQSMSLDEVHLVAQHKTTDPNTVILQAEGKGHALRSDRTVEPKYVVFLTFRDGLIARWQDYWNPLAFLISMGGNVVFPEPQA